MDSDSWAPFEYRGVLLEWRLMGPAIESASDGERELGVVAFIRRPGTQNTFGIVFVSEEPSTASVIHVLDTNNTARFALLDHL